MKGGFSLSDEEEQILEEYDEEEEDEEVNSSSLPYFYIQRKLNMFNRLIEKIEEDHVYIGELGR